MSYKHLSNENTANSKIVKYSELHYFHQIILYKLSQQYNVLKVLTKNKKKCNTTILCSDCTYPGKVGGSLSPTNLNSIKKASDIRHNNE